MLEYIPTTFFALNSFLELVAVFSAFVISYLSYKAYKFTSEGKYFGFSTAFFLIALSFIARAIAHSLIYLGFREQPTQLFQWFSEYGVLGYIVLLLIAYLLIVIANLGIRNKKVIILLFILSFITVFNSVNPSLRIFNQISIILLFFVTLNLYQAYNSNRSKQSLVVFTAFGLLTISHVFLLLNNAELANNLFQQLDNNLGTALTTDVDGFRVIFYLLAHLSQVIAFLGLFLTNITFLKRGRVINRKTKRTK